MAELLLPSLEIENFRAFKHLTIEKLGRVNLIVGKNSVGKTCLLEAVWIYANKADPRTLQELLSGRDERNIPVQSQSNEADNALYSLRHLFFDRRLDIGTSRIAIGAMEYLRSIHLSVDCYALSEDENSPVRFRTKISITDDIDLDDIQVRLTIMEGNNKDVERSYPVEYLGKRGMPMSIARDKRQSAWHFLSTNGLDKDEVARLWDASAILGLDNEALTILKVIQPTIERLIMVEERDGRSRIPMVKLQSSDHFVPLRSLGDGMWRALGISLALVNSKNGILLIDEFENGLYHGVQTDLWRLIFRVAHELNVQVFATTHNWDCIEAFQKAAQEDQNEEAMLIRLQRQGEDIIAVTYDERELMIATREHIEVR